MSGEGMTLPGEAFDVAICGAGPGGLAAARALAAAGARVVMIDEQMRSGGQFLRQPPAAFRVEGWLKSSLYRAGKALLSEVEALPGLDWRFATTVHGLFDDGEDEPHRWRLWVSDARGTGEILARAVIISTGCYDLPVPYPGWTLPGAMSAGGIQTLVKSQQMVPGKKIVLSGSHPLQIILAGQLIDAGADIAALCLPQRFATVWPLLARPDILLRHQGKFRATAEVMMRLRHKRVPIHFGAVVIRALGKTGAFGAARVEGAEIALLDATGQPRSENRRRVDCDVVGTCYGFLASSELARQAGADSFWDGPRGGWLIRVDRWQQSSEIGLYAAGEITGVEGSDVAMAEGAIAGLGCASALGLLAPEAAEAQARPARAALAKHRQFAALLAKISDPGPGLVSALATDETILCRCEDLTRGALEQALADNSFISSSSGLKLLTRAGMGPCQGRMCGHSIQGLVAATGRQQPGTAPQAFTPRAPVKPFGLWHGQQQG